MKRVYRAADIIEAQMVLDDLLAAGLKAHVSGSYLTGAIGDLPQDSVVSVWISSEQHYDRAREVVDAFEKARNTEHPDRFCRKCGEKNAGSFSQCWSCEAFFPAD